MHVNEIVQYLQNYKSHEFDQGQSRQLLKSFTSYIQIKNTKTTRLLYKGSWILPFFSHSNWHYFGYILGKVAKPHFLESPQKSLKTRYEITAFWKYEKFVFFSWLLFRMKKLLTFGIFNESNIWAKVYHIWKIEVYGSTIVEITGRRSCYFSSLSIVWINLITSTQK